MRRFVVLAGGIISLAWLAAHVPASWPTATAAQAGALPDHRLTPGAVADANPRVVCAYGYARAHRDVPYSVRDRVYDEYGLPRGTRAGRYRIDHLIPLEIGGANVEANLWPQTVADSEVKDRVEDALHVAVCVNHTLTLEQAQRAIAHDWRETPVGSPAP